MLRLENTKITYEKSLISVSDPIVKKIADRGHDDKIVKLDELQLELKNISNQAVDQLEVDLNYYNSTNRFLGNDSDLRLEPLHPGEKHIFKCFIEAPPGTEKFELLITCKKYGAREKVRDFISKPWVIGLIIILVIADRFYGR